jgi:hypothetical protein
MKRIVIAMAAMLFINGVFAQAKKPDEVAKFSSETVDLGKIKKGNPVTASFTITNISKQDLIIENVTPGCGCTKSDYTKEPIKPGKKGTITATYNAANAGNFSKSVYVKFMGIDEQKSISIMGVVEE